MDILYLWDHLALICHWWSVHIRYLFCTCPMPYSYSYCLIYFCCISEIFYFKCMFCKDQTRIVQTIFKSLLSFSFCLMKLITAFCYDCVNDCATMSSSSNIFHSINCTIVYLDPGLWDQKLPKLCSMSSNKISDALFLWSHLWRLVWNTESYEPDRYHNFHLTEMLTCQTDNSVVNVSYILKQEKRKLHIPRGGSSFCAFKAAPFFFSVLSCYCEQEERPMKVKFS